MDEFEKLLRESDSKPSGQALPGTPNLEGKIECSNCHRYYFPKDFYQDKEGRPMHKCKKCLASLIDLNSRSTVLSILKEVDAPFIPEEWNILRERYEYSTNKAGAQIRNPNANQSVLGRYLGKMKLMQFKDYTFADTPRFTESYDSDVKKERDDFFLEFNSLLDKGMTTTEVMEFLLGRAKPKVEEDKSAEMKRRQTVALQQKWGESYTPEELVKLETFYGEMHGSYDITTASHEDYLKQICKISMRMHSLIEAGMYDEYKKLSDIYDRMMKSAKFTASQERVEDRYVDSISEMVRICEEKGFIPVYHVNEPQDIVDVTLRDFENYVKNLVAKELNLDSLIEKGLELIKLDQEKEAIAENVDDLLFDDDDIVTDEDIVAEILGDSKTSEMTEEAKQLGVVVDES